MSHKITVLYFAAVKDITGKESEEIQIAEDNYTLNTLSSFLITKYGKRLQEILSISMYAIDMEYVEKDKEPTTLLTKNSEVAIIPPQLLFSFLHGCVITFMLDSYFFFASSIAALVARLITYPFDTIKTRLQTNYEHRHYSRLTEDGSPEKAYDKVSSLYRGIGITLLFSVPALTTYMATYASTKAFLSSLALTLLDKNALLNHAVSGLLAESAAGLFFTPMEVVKSQLQIDTHHTGTWTLAKYIAKEEGLFGFYRGYWITLAVFVPHSVAYFIIYEYLKSFWGNDDQTFLTYTFCAAVASAVGIFVSTPLDVIKTRWQVSSQEESYRGGPLKIALHMWKHEGGISAFSRGLMARIAWGIPLTTIHMAVFEWLLKIHK